MNHPRIAVFCGFRGVQEVEVGGTVTVSEKDFVYMLLEVFATGQLSEESRRPGAGEGMTSSSPLFGKFYLVRELGEGSPVKEASDLIDDCDFAVVVLPYREQPAGEKAQFHTSLYALMEYAYACGTGLPVILVPESRVGAENLGFAAELHRWPNIDRDSLKNSANQNLWASLKQDFDVVSKRFLLKKPFVRGFHEWKVDEFYRTRLIPLVLHWHEIHIYNHSILPLSSSYLPAEMPAQDGNVWEQFNGVQPHPFHQPHRGLYFEIEEALVTGSSDRLERMIDAAPQGTFDRNCIEQLQAELRRAADEEPFTLTRFASLIPSEAYSAFPSDNDRSRALARDLSILLQMYRLHRRQHAGTRVRYELFGFKTYYPYSMPTTIYAERERTDGKPLKISGVWGFLRSSGSAEPGHEEDSFIIGQNRDCVRVWEQHLKELQHTDAADKPTPLFVSGSGAQFGNFFRLIGADMRDRLREEIKRRGWQDVLSVTGIDSTV